MSKIAKQVARVLASRGRGPGQALECQQQIALGLVQQKYLGCQSPANASQHDGRNVWGTGASV
eukprot:5669388-Amphidinium_carterae.1